MTTKEVYVAYDGTEFYDKDRCKEHEMKLDKQQYKTLIKAIKGIVSNERINKECDRCPLVSRCDDFFVDSPPCKWDKQEILRFSITEDQ
jgi:hypothetical protein